MMLQTLSRKLYRDFLFTVMTNMFKDLIISSSFENENAILYIRKKIIILKKTVHDEQ